jgi:hypothetical protein
VELVYYLVADGYKVKVISTLGNKGLGRWGNMVVELRLRGRKNVAN